MCESARITCDAGVCCHIMIKVWEPGSICKIKVDVIGSRKWSGVSWGFRISSVCKLEYILVGKKTHCTRRSADRAGMNEVDHCDVKLMQKC